MSSRTEGGEDTPKQPPKHAMPQHDNGVAYVELPCPRCGGVMRRRWQTVCALDFVIFVVFLMLTFMVLSLGSGVVKGVLFLISLGMALASLFALPITGALAVVARPRCSRCGHRAWPASAASCQIDEARFPLWVALIGSATLLVPLGIGSAWVIGAPGTETMDVGFMVAGRVIMAVLTFGIGLLSQAILWRVLRTRATCGIRRGLVLLLPAVVLGAGWLALTGHDHSVLVRKYGPLVRAPWILRRAQLAELPGSANGVTVYMFISFICSAKCYLCFAAEPNEIERFLANSPSLKDLRCQTYSKQRMRLASSDHRLAFRHSESSGHEYSYPRPESGGRGYSSPRLEDSGHEYFYPSGSPPAWYKEEIRGAGRRYEINPGASNWVGEVIVDDEQHVVYVHLYWK